MGQKDPRIHFPQNERPGKSCSHLKPLGGGGGGGERETGNGNEKSSAALGHLSLQHAIHGRG